MSPAYTHIANLAAQAEPPAQGILSRTIHNDEQLKAVVFGFDQGQELTEHTASKPAILQIIRGEATLTLGDDTVERPGRRLDPHAGRASPRSQGQDSGGHAALALEVVSQPVGPDAVMSQSQAIPIGLDQFSRPGRWESTANPARMMRLHHISRFSRKRSPKLVVKVRAEGRILFRRTSRPQPSSPRISPEAWPTHKREAEERMTSILDMMSTYNLIDFKFWIEIAAVLFVMTVGRDAFLHQWLGGSH